MVGTGESMETVLGLNHRIYIASQQPLQEVQEAQATSRADVHQLDDRVVSTLRERLWVRHYNPFYEQASGSKFPDSQMAL